MSVFVLWLDGFFGAAACRWFLLRAGLGAPARLF